MSHLHSEFKGSSNWLIGKCDYICNYIDTYSKLMRLLTLWINTAKLGQLSLWLHYAVMGQVSTQKMGYRRFASLPRQLHAKSFTALWLDSDTFCPPSALQNNRTCFGEGRLGKKIYSRRLGEKVREQIHSVSSTTVTMHIEEAGFQASKCVDFKMSVWNYRQLPPPHLPFLCVSPLPPLGRLHIDKHMGKESAGFVGPKKQPCWINSEIYSVWWGRTGGELTCCCQFTPSLIPPI